MNYVLLIAPALALATLGAHFHRAGHWPLTLACAALIALLALPRAWVPRLVQAALLLGAIEWAVTAVALIQQRIAFGQPWNRLAFILSTVTLLTAASAFVFESRRLRTRHRRAGKNAG